jgi:two-component system sensor histidine kinase BarA
MNHSIIDWELGAKLAGNNLATAKELLTLLIEHLPNDLTQIKSAFTDKQYEKLTYHVHHLHGALCYVGTPRLKAATQQLDTALRQNKLSEINNLYFQFEKDANNLIAAWQAMLAE